MFRKENTAFKYIQNNANGASPVTNLWLMSAPFCYLEISFQGSCSCLQLFQSESSQLGYYKKIKNNNKNIKVKVTWSIILSSSQWQTRS